MQPIVGDGNCLFRAVSKEATLSEEHHHFFRMAACNTMKDKRYAAQFEGMHIPEQLCAKDYVAKAKMDKLGTWGSDVEVIALATLLRTRIAIYYRAPSADKFTWLNYDTVVHVSNMQGMAIYLKNAGNHFERVMSVKTVR